MRDYVADVVFAAAVFIVAVIIATAWLTHYHVTHDIEDLKDDLCEIQPTLERCLDDVE